MGLARSWSVSLHGLEGSLVEVEADVSSGLPAFVLIGLEQKLPLAIERDRRGYFGRSSGFGGLGFRVGGMNDGRRDKPGESQRAEEGFSDVHKIRS